MSCLVRVRRAAIVPWIYYRRNYPAINIYNIGEGQNTIFLIPELTTHSQHQLQQREKLVKFSLRSCVKLLPLYISGCLVVSRQFLILHLVTPGYWAAKRKGVSLQLQATQPELSARQPWKVTIFCPIKILWCRIFCCDQYVKLKSKGNILASS